MEEIEFETMDDYDDVHRIEQSDEQVAALEALGVFVASIESNGFSKADHQALQFIDNELYDSLPKVGYTNQPSRQGLVSTISAIAARGKEILKDLFIFLIDLIDKVISFIVEKIFSSKKKPADQAMAAGNAEIVKSQKAYIAVLEKRIADLEKAQLPEGLKSQKQQLIDTIINETHPAVMPIATEADQYYSTLVRSLYKHPEQLNTFLGFAVAIPMMSKIAVSMIDNIDRLFILLRDFGNSEAVTNSIVTLGTLSNSFKHLLEKTCHNHAIVTSRLQQKHGQLSLPHVWYSDTTDPVEYIRSMRDSLLNASNQPSGANFKKEYPNDLTEVTNARIKIGDQLKAVDAVFYGCEESFSELLARSRELGRYIKEHDGIPSGKSEIDPALRKELVAMNRSLQKTITTILRLRNVSDVIRNSVQKQISYSIRRVNAAGMELKKV